MTEERTMTMKDAIVTICEAASKTLLDMTERFKKKQRQLHKLEALTADLEQLHDEALCDDEAECSWRRRIDDMQRELDSTNHDTREPIGTATVVAKQIQQGNIVHPAAGGGWWSGFFSAIQDSTVGPSKNVLASLEIQGKMSRRVELMTQRLQDQLAPLASELKEKQRQQKCARTMFYGAMESNTNSGMVSGMCSLACSDLVTLARTLDENGAQAAMCVQPLLHRARKIQTGLPNEIASWQNVRAWETLEVQQCVTDLLQAKWCDVTEVDLLAMRAVEGHVKATEALRQILCLPPSEVPLVLSEHVKRVILITAAPFMEDPFPPITDPLIVHTLLHIVRNNLLDFFECKDLVELSEHTSLSLDMRQAVIKIGELASHGHDMAFDYLVHLCGSKDWSTRQLALARASRVMHFIVQKDKMQIANQMLQALFDEQENPAVRETAETVLVDALKDGLSKNAQFVRALLAAATLWLNASPTPRNRAAWERIMQGGSLKDSVVLKKGQAPKGTVVRGYRQELYQREQDREDKELKGMLGM